MTMLPIAERDYQQTIIEAARLYRWRVHYSWPYRSPDGRPRPVHADKGWPDLVLCRPPRLLAIEVKGSRGKLSAEQLEWIDNLRACGVEAFVTWPSAWDELHELLK